jgi:hypothetical protein
MESFPSVDMVKDIGEYTGGGATQSLDVVLNLDACSMRLVSCIERIVPGSSARE